MHRFLKWLLFGCSSTIEIEGMSIPPEFNETILLITKNKLFVFSLNKTKNFFNEVTSKINNVELFITSKKEEENSDNLQILKISKFIEWTNQAKKIGIPLDHEQSQKIITIEKWPLLAATGLDSLKQGFFTMNHEIVDIRKDLETIYHEIDLDTCCNIINSKTNLLESTITDFYMYFERENMNKRLERSEENMNENQNLELIRLNYFSLKDTVFDYLQDLPDPRVLYGTNSNNDFGTGCSTEALYKTTFDYKVPAFHMTYENMDPITGIRIGRTLFLFNLQEKYLDLNQETFKYDFVPTLIYKEAFYLFNLYYIIIAFSRKFQFEIILNKLSISKAKETLCKQLNDYIMGTCSKDYFDYLINEKNILIDIREYCLVGKANKGEKENKIIVLRLELKEILSGVSHRRVGSLLFCDSFLYCYDELFNLTSDILPVKFISTTTKHLKLEEYNHNQILKTVSNVKIQDIEYKALAFFQDKYNIPYIFPDSHEVGLDHNQMFIFFSGRLNIFEDYVVFNDSAMGSVIASLENIKKFSYLEELKYTVMLFEFIDGASLPLTGVIKPEFVCYFRGNTERLRGYSRSIIDFLRESPKMKGKIASMTKDKYFEYEIVIKTMNENEYENLSYISNSFNLTNINDVLNEMFEYEYLKYNHTDKNLGFNDYRRIKEEALEEIETEKLQKGKKKLMFLFGPDPKNVFSIKDKILDFAKKSGYKTNLISPPFSVFNINEDSIERKVKEFYINAVKKIEASTNINIVCAYHSCNILNLLYDIVKNIDNFQEEFEILNVSYVINYSTFKANQHKDIINKDFYYENLVNFLFIDEGVLPNEKIEKYNKLISLSNPVCKTFNHRSFFLNTKELISIFDKKYITEKILNYYFEYYKDLACLVNSYQNCFIPFKYMCKEDLFKDFMKKGLNYPLKLLFKDCEKYPTEYQDNSEFHKVRIDTEEDYQKWLCNVANIDKEKAKDPYFIQMFGYCTYITKENIENKKERDIQSFYSYYKEQEIIPLKKKDIYPSMRSEIGIFVLGKNLNFTNSKEFFNKMILTLSGEFPVFRKYRTRDDLTKEERENLNFANLSRPLPPGWSLEGPVVIDPDDVIHYEHPDIEMFIDEYILMNNNAIDEHNKDIQKEIDSLLI